MKVTTTYIEGERFVSVRMTVAEVRSVLSGGFIRAALEKKLGHSIKSEPTIGG